MSNQPQFFGEIALEKSYVTIPQLYEALTLQARLEVHSEPYKFIGEILTELGHMTDLQVLDVLNEIHCTEETV